MNPHRARLSSVGAGESALHLHSAGGENRASEYDSQRDGVLASDANEPARRIVHFLAGAATHFFVRPLSRAKAIRQKRDVSPKCRHK